MAKALKSVPQAIGEKMIYYIDRLVNPLEVKKNNQVKQ